MKNNVRIEVDSTQSEDIVITCKSITPDVMRLRQIALGEEPATVKEMLFHIGSEEFILPLSEVLFFESDGARITVHAKDKMYYTDKTLSQLTDILGGDFFRVSKSCIVNIRKICSLRRELTGICEVGFSGSGKTVYISRMYYKPFRERFDEIRLG